MPEREVVAAIAVGVFGKIPARGDFVRLGLPRGFTDPWDDWMQAMIAAGRAALGEQWTSRWMEAPIWRFALPGGQCGPFGATGVWMPSVDRAGRHFPLTLAAVAEDARIPGGDAWLAEAEQAGLEALEHDLDPPALMLRLEAAASPVPGTAFAARWWTEGGPFVPAASLTADTLPDAARFILMLDSAAP